MESHSVPQSLEHENVVIATLLVDPTSYLVANEIIQPRHFFSNRNRLIWNAVEEVVTTIPDYDSVMIGDHLEKTGKLESVDGWNGINHIIENNIYASTDMQMIIHCEHIRDSFIRREIMLVLSKTLDKARSIRGDIRDIAEEAEQGVFNLTGQLLTERKLDIGAILGEIISKGEKGKPCGINTRFKALDDMIGGFKKSQLYIIAARPSRGKSSMAMNIAEDFCRDGKSIAFFSIEMSINDILEKMLASVAKINTKIISSGMYSENLIMEALKASQEIVKLKWHLDDTTEITVRGVHSKCRRIIQQHGPLDAVFIDYLQLMRYDDMRVSREERVSGNSRALKIMAKELDIPVIVMAQLNRDVDKREKARPRLSDLRESGAIEQDADVVMFLHRPGFDEGNNNGDTELIVAKNRHGDTGTVYLHFVGEHVTFAPDRARELEGGLL